MADAKHAIPSPWHVDSDDRHGMEHNNHILAANGNTVCFMAWSGDPEHNEDHEKAAHLIAAAPDLLEALQQLLKADDNQSRSWARAAIAKALGEAT